MCYSTEAQMLTIQVEGLWIHRADGIVDYVAATVAAASSGSMFIFIV